MDSCAIALPRRRRGLKQGEMKVDIILMIVSLQRLEKENAITSKGSTKTHLQLWEIGRGKSQISATNNLNCFYSSVSRLKLDHLPSPFLLTKQYPPPKKSRNNRTIPFLPQIPSSSPLSQFLSSLVNHLQEPQHQYDNSARNPSKTSTQTNNKSLLAHSLPFPTRRVSSCIGLDRVLHTTHQARPTNKGQSPAANAAQISTSTLWAYLSNIEKKTVLHPACGMHALRILHLMHGGKSSRDCVHAGRKRRMQRARFAAGRWVCAVQEGRRPERAKRRAANHFE